MTLADERLKELDDPSLGEDGRALLRCGVAADLIHKGQYGAAAEALGELWPGAGRRPPLKALSPAAGAELLLRCGTLTGWLGSVGNVPGAQEQAKDLLSEAGRRFRSQGLLAKSAEAHYELGMCYWRLGQYDEARVSLDEAIRELGGRDDELKAKVLIRHTLVELWTGRHHDAWNILDEARAFFEASGDAVKGRWHGQRGIILLKLANTEGRQDFADRAIIEFTAAIFHYEQAGHERYCAINLNNLAFLLFKLGRYGEAHQQLDRARAIFERLKYPGNLAQVDETRARVLVAEGKYREAARVLEGVVRGLEQGGEAALLADALTVQGVARARLGSSAESLESLRRAMRVAQEAGANTQAGLAALTLIEEHGSSGRVPDSELAEVYGRADALLRETQDAEDIARLRACARVVVGRLAGAQMHEEGFSFYGAVHELEERLIGRALELEGGSVSRAAKRLGLKHQSLSHMLSARHKRLMGKRTPPAKRRRSIIKKDG